MTSSFTVIIPSRYGSTRLPAKALIEIPGTGKPLVQHAWESATASAAQQVFVATDHQSIAEHCAGIGASFQMTSIRHQSGTDRVAEVVDQLRLGDDEVVVNVQGDEVGLPPELIDQVAGILAREPEYSMATLCEPFESEAAAQDTSNVKVSFDATGRALSFSRAYRPGPGGDPPWGYRHIGLYAYRAGFLRKFTRMPQSHSELRERLEQLRALDSGYAVYVEVACRPAGHGIDTPADLERAATWALSMHTTLRDK
ncbi:MAG: hypothetical protein A3H91_06495 [Gammaproteobacteria bacterium RIFCSPLOWO2_02_FULL_61_13]|nr:MAG: hypothetical protein A3H91_06495 [Gammaproteobacteria bacterium RIFCSPLOWO2_02_FULL_61_13]